MKPSEPPEPFTEPAQAPSPGAVADGAKRIEWGYAAFLLHKLAACREQLSAQPPREITQRTFLPGPEVAQALRGQWVFATGTVAAEAEPKLVEADRNPSGVWTVYDTFIEDKHGKLLRIWLIDKEREYWVGDRVLVRGLFFKIHGYVANNGEESFVPLLLALPVEPPVEPEETFAWLPITVAGVVVVSCLLLAISVFVTARGDRKAREERVRRRAERRQGPANPC